MKNIAIVTSGGLPVPAVRGGAVETLTEYLVNGNEEAGRYNIDLYTIGDKKLAGYHYKFTNIITVNDSRLTHVYYRIRNLLFHRLLHRTYSPEYTGMLCKKLDKKEYDLIVVENQLHLFQSIYENTHHKKNMIVHLHNNIDDSRTPESCKFADKYADGIIVISEYMKRQYSGYIAPEKIKVLPNCVHDRFRNCDVSTARTEERRKYGIHDHEFVFFFSGRIEPYKGILELIRSFRLVLNEHPHCKLVIVGGDFRNTADKSPYMKELQKVSEDIQDRIVFTGFIYPDDMPSVLSMADTVMIPSTWEEPFGVVALEAMSVNIPIIATNSGALPEILEDGAGIIVEHGDGLINELYSAMLEVMQNKELCNRMRLKQQKIMLEKKEYNKDSYFAGFEKCIKELGLN